jgi:hypothetical protein
MHILGPTSHLNSPTCFLSSASHLWFMISRSYVTFFKGVEWNKGSLSPNETWIGNKWDYKRRNIWPSKVQSRSAHTKANAADVRTIIDAELFISVQRRTHQQQSQQLAYPPGAKHSSASAAHQIRKLFHLPTTPAVYEYCTWIAPRTMDTKTNKFLASDEGGILLSMVMDLYFLSMPIPIPVFTPFKVKEWSRKSLWSHSEYLKKFLTPPRAQLYGICNLVYLWWYFRSQTTDWSSMTILPITDYGLATKRTRL